MLLSEDGDVGEFDDCDSPCLGGQVGIAIRLLRRSLIFGTTGMKGTTGILDARTLSIAAVNDAGDSFVTESLTGACSFLKLSESPA